MTSYSVFIGRFQPCHVGHLQVIREALKKTDELIIVLGSHNQAPTCRNPFTSAERANMIRLACEDVNLDFSRVHITTVEDQPYNLNRWIESVQTAVRTVIWQKFSPDPTPIFLIGHKKDHTSFYLDLFPTWNSLGVDNFKGLSATDIRENIFEDQYIYCHEYVFENVTKSVSEFIVNWCKSEVGNNLLEEWEMIKKYKEAWKAAPYAPTFMTTDAVVTQAGHVLMVTRGAAPGKGLLALPGGFLNEFETLENGMIRELREETKIDVPDKVLRGNIVWNRTFDDPHRSARGRTITQAYHIDLGAKGKLPKVKGSDDAIKAQWIEMSKLDGNLIFEDHLAVIRVMVGI